MKNWIKRMEANQMKLQEILDKKRQERQEAQERLAELLRTAEEKMKAQQKA
jgi:hypothetical protein